jgi:hypothetical protein
MKKFSEQQVDSSGVFGCFFFQVKARAKAFVLFILFLVASYSRLRRFHYKDCFDFAKCNLIRKQLQPRSDPEKPFSITDTKNNMATQASFESFPMHNSARTCDELTQTRRFELILRLAFSMIVRQDSQRHYVMKLKYKKTSLARRPRNSPL